MIIQLQILRPPVWLHFSWSTELTNCILPGTSLWCHVNPEILGSPAFICSSCLGVNFFANSGSLSIRCFSFSVQYLNCSVSEALLNSLAIQNLPFESWRRKIGHWPKRTVVYFVIFSKKKVDRYEMHTYWLFHGIRQSAMFNNRTMPLNYIWKNNSPSLTISERWGVTFYAAISGISPTKL